MGKSYHVVVIGGGIVGLNTAERLLADGHQVTLVEKTGIAAGASFGNAAGLAISDIMPLASPGIVKKAIKWFLDPVGPFAVVPQDLFKVMPWLIKFLKAARPAQFKTSIDVQASLMHLAAETYPKMLERTGLQDMVRTNGALHLYESEASFKADLEKWKFREKHGITFQTFDKTALHQFQPGLSDRFVAGIYANTWKSVSNPNDFCHAIFAYLTEKGVNFVQKGVKNVKNDGVELEDSTEIKADKIVIAAGPWSKTLAAALGDNIPLIGERGYNTTLPKSAWEELDHTLVFSDHGFVVTPLANGVRVGGASEIASLDSPANYKRSEHMLNKADKFLPALNTEGGEQWMGRRPSIPDTLPVISYSSASDSIIYAFGHGHLGLTQSTATGELVANLIQGEKPNKINMNALGAARFK
ncbi:MAG: FAD-binding oxidoreductase [Sneathiella sp.]|nr:FAD-binding oxidoreductase [Sneathiella sp.]